MTARKKTVRTPGDAVSERLSNEQFKEDLFVFFEFATAMRAEGAAKVMVSRGEGVDYIVEFEAEEEKTDATERHAAGFYMGETEECEDD